MANKKEKTSMIPTSKGEGPQWFKGYDIRWLKDLEGEHPDFPFVAEYEEEYGKIT